MKKQSNKSKWRAYTLFSLIPSPVRKEKQFSLPDDFSDIDLTDSLTNEPFRVRLSRAFSSFHIPSDRCSLGVPYLNVLHDEGEA